MAAETAAIVRHSATVSSIITEELRPAARHIDAEGIYPTEILRRLGEAGAFAHHTESHGAGPAGIGAAVDTMAELGAVGLSTVFRTWCQDVLGSDLPRADNPVPRHHSLAAAAGGRLLGL